MRLVTSFLGDLYNPEAIVRKSTDNWLHTDDVVKLCSVPRTGVNRDVNLNDAIRTQMRDNLAAYE